MRTKRPRNRASACVTTAFALLIASVAQAAPAAGTTPPEKMSRRLALAAETPAAPAPVRPALTLSAGKDEDWRRRDANALFWTGAGLVAASALLIVGGVALLNLDGQGTCDAPEGTVCEHLYETTIPGWVAIAAGAEAALGGAALMLIYRGSDVNVALSPNGLAGTF